MNYKIMYRIVTGTELERKYAVKLLTSGRDAAQELAEIKAFIDHDWKVEIVNDFDEVEVELITREYL